MKKTLLKYTTKMLNKRSIIAVFVLCIGFANAQVTNVLVPFSGSTSIPCGQNSLVQAHNGSIGTYSNNANGYCVINAGFAAAITIACSYTTEASFDYVRIYNGIGTTGTLLNSVSGQNLTFTYTGTPGQTLTLQFISDGSVVYAGFDALVTFNGPCFSTPCAGIPSSNTVIGAPTSICPAMNSTMALASQYQIGGIQYQWYQSTVSNVGTFTPVAASATLNGLVTSTLATTTWYTAVITCTNSNQSFTTSALQVLVNGQTTTTVPYGESFEGVQVPNMLPNCSWSAANLGTSVRTFTSSLSNNRLPRTGNNYAYYQLPSTNNTMYTNGIYMEPGITNSAGLFYATEYFGYSNWTNLSLAVGLNQNSIGQIPVASAAPAVSGPYKALGGYFTVPTAGLYYLSIKASGTNGSALYLMIDDVSVTIPCTPASGNSPTVTANASNSVICAGDAVALTATGADTYSWNTGATGGNISDSPITNTVYTVAGTNTLTGCMQLQTISVMVNPSPTVAAFASSPEICPGQVTYLSAVGANSYAWNNASTGPNISVSPNTSTSYTVVGTNANGCSASGVVAVTVKSAPNITVVNANGSNSCQGDAITLTANGGVSYSWFSSSSSILYNGNPLTVVLSTSSTFTVTGTGANGCSGKTTLSQNVDICGGIANVNAVNSSLQLYPNPTSGKVVLKSSAASIDNVEFVDLSGRIVLAQTVNAEQVELDLSNLSLGVYFVHVKSGAEHTVVRLVKN